MRPFLCYSCTHMAQLLSGLPALADFAATLVAGLTPTPEKATVIGLSGDLGSGKTAFTKECARLLGVTEEVLSPTFVIAKFYPLSGRAWAQLVHIDAYRIEDPTEIRVLRWDDLLADPRNLVIIEWPEQLGDLFPTDAQQLHFRFIDETTREVG